MADNLNFGAGNTYNLFNCGAVAGTGFSFTSTATTNAVINGKFTATLGAQTNAATPTVDSATNLPFNALPPGNCCSLVFGITSNGTMQMVQGKVIATGAGSGNTPGSLINDPQFPGLPNDFCPLAYTVVRTAPTASPWTPGASAWTATGVVASTFQNVAQLQNRPQAQ